MVTFNLTCRPSNSWYKFSTAYAGFRFQFCVVLFHGRRMQNTKSTVALTWKARETGEKKVTMCGWRGKGGGGAEAAGGYILQPGKWRGVNSWQYSKSVFLFSSGQTCFHSKLGIDFKHLEGKKNYWLSLITRPTLYLLLFLPSFDHNQ